MTIGAIQPFLEAANHNHRHELTFLPPALTLETVALAAGHQAICVFVNDPLSRPVLPALAALGIRLVALRSATLPQGEVTTANVHA